MRRRLHLRQPRIRTLEIFRREAAQIGAEGGEVPAVGDDPEARGLERLSEGDLLEAIYVCLSTTADLWLSSPAQGAGVGAFCNVQSGP